MRRLILASFVLLAGCATRPETPPVVQQPVQPPPVRQQLTRITGMTTQELLNHFGKPALQIREGTSLKLQFRGIRCVLDAYLYPSSSGTLQVTYVDVRSPSGVDFDRTDCITSLETRS